MLEKFNSYYNKRNKQIGRMLRSNMTRAEACLWKYALRAGQMKGFTFRRQRPVLNYVADFMCKELSLIVEVDGITHLDEDAKEKNRRRELDLVSVGFRIIRFTDEAILNNINGVIDALENFIDKLSLSDPPPFNSPADGGYFLKEYNALLENIKIDNRY